MAGSRSWLSRCLSRRADTPGGSTAGRWIGCYCNARPVLGEEYAATLQDLLDPELVGSYVEEAQRLRNEIAEGESLTHESDVGPTRELDAAAEVVEISLGAAADNQSDGTPRLGRSGRGPRCMIRTWT